MKIDILLRNCAICALLFTTSLNLYAERSDTILTNGWNFRHSHNVADFKGVPVALPHTWNTTDALVGQLDYELGIGNYMFKLDVPETMNETMKSKRLFLRFEGANSVTNLLVNGRHVGEPRGGYAAFMFEITDFVKFGAINNIWVRVNNAEQLDVMPLVGDFNFYGGIHRLVHLVATERECISPLDYASLEVYLITKKLDKLEAIVDARAFISDADKKFDNLRVEVFVF